MHFRRGEVNLNTIKDIGEDDISTHSHLYKKYRWQQSRKRYLFEHPLCAFCLDDDIYMQATVVDHIIPHRGNLALFWDESNWQGLCATCHSSTKQRMEKGGSRFIGCDADGRPFDPKHSAYGSTKYK
ncbi:HNH endonuclease signature motif containing protein [Salinicola sp. V024]|uniref:HNH endonuclease signature motif containing protein n=1 Tax=Salinicola sp. V024 TaxID=3459609 RepID=UPI004044B946